MWHAEQGFIMLSQENFSSDRVPCTFRRVNCISDKLGMEMILSIRSEENWPESSVYDLSVIIVSPHGPRHAWEFSASYTHAKISENLNHRLSAMVMNRSMTLQPGIEASRANLLARY
ncbi:hypothetical protein QQP08_002699 [Theobroma cacao]|nr:hypothetical protein QQP08_002699 [Theobroma cacao]